MAYERIDDPYRTPQNHIGERPYEGPIGAVKRFLDKVGKRRLAGISGAILAPTGPGVSDFQAGFGGYQGGVQNYDKQILDAMRLQNTQDLAERRVAAQEKTAGAAESRASTYRTWAENRSRTGTDVVGNKNKLLEWYTGLTPEQQANAKAAGLIPRDPTGGRPDNEDQNVKALMDQYGMTESHARLISSIRPGLTGTTDSFIEDPKTKEIRRTAKRTFALPKKVIGILALYGLKPDDIFPVGDTEGFEPPAGYGSPTGGDDTESGGDTVAPDAYDDLGIDEIESILHDYDAGDLELSDEELQLIMERLERMTEEGEAVEQRMDQRNRFQY